MSLPSLGEIRPNSATPGHISPNPVPTTTLSPAGLKAALAFIDGRLDGLRQAIAPAVASLPAGDHPILWINHNLAVCAYELQEAQHAAELLEDGAATTVQGAGQ